ncbi:MAG: oxygen-independent coproporphyrinogen III oxidase [Clostridia bacterium]|nr:oxygen-independent coproporphyrinogen III oxidase [Clostridia bacterium]
MDKKELGIYIHIPFCKQKCYYCDFISYANQCEEISPYIEALVKEIESFDFSNYQVTSIYIGGGTPSYLESQSIQQILAKLQAKIDFKEVEITIEVNPGTVTEEKLKDYKEAGINRISIGLQSTEDRLLKQMGRIHTYEDFSDTYHLAQEIGFQNINVDLMLGLPNQTIEDLKRSLTKVVNLNPNHISIYSLIVEEKTKMAKLLEEGKLVLPEEEQERRMYWYVKDFLELKGYEHYEISNFAKKGKESKHNSNCWNQEEYIGFGVAAHSYLNRIRFRNLSNIKKYIQNIQTNQPRKNIKIEEEQTLEEQKNEFMMLGFRKLEGVNIAKFKEKFVDNPIFLYRNKLNQLAKDGLIEIDLNYIRLTKKGLDLANLVFEEFI